MGLYRDLVDNLKSLLKREKTEVAPKENPVIIDETRGATLSDKILSVMRTPKGARESGYFPSQANLPKTTNNPPLDNEKSQQPSASAKDKKPKF